MIEGRISVAYKGCNEYSMSELLIVLLENKQNSWG